MTNQIMQAMQQAKKDGQSAVALDFHLIDFASIKPVEDTGKKT